MNCTVRDVEAGPIDEKGQDDVAVDVRCLKALDAVVYERD